MKKVILLAGIVAATALFAGCCSTSKCEDKAKCAKTEAKCPADCEAKCGKDCKKEVCAGKCATGKCTAECCKAAPKK